jgi:muconolactone delta-isomerase
MRPERFLADCQGLITALKDQLAAAVAEREVRTEAERTAAEAARLEAEAQAAARAQAAEERSRAQAAEGLSEEAIRKAEELANWEFAKDRNDVQDLRDHLARFPAGTTDWLVWVALGAAPDIARLRAYLDEFPTGFCACTAASKALWMAPPSYRSIQYATAVSAPGRAPCPTRGPPESEDPPLDNRFTGSL